MFSEDVRRWGFWTLDYLKKSRISKQFDDIKDIMEDTHSGKKKSHEYLIKLLNHAVNTTEFYACYKNYKNLYDFPVIRKQDIKEKYNKFLSSKYETDNLIKVQTSGSYGTPFSFYLTPEKKFRQTAEVIYFSEWANYYVGTKHAYFRGVNSKSNFKLRMQNEYFLFSRVIDNEWLKSSREILKNQKIKVLIGFPTAISAIAQYCYEQGNTYEDFSIIGVITSSESLIESQRAIIESTFGCNCLSRYSTEELGVLANECSNTKKHHINTASYKIEILDLNEDRPAKDGEVGRIVVTDLFSYAMPLIRYETGDLGILGNGCDCGLEGPIIERLHGRTVESVYNTKGTRILPYFIEDVMEGHTDVFQYQFIQYGEKEYTLKIKGKENLIFDYEKTIKHIKFWMGNDALVKIEMIDDIPTLASGKRPYVLNEYKPYNG